MCVWGGGGRGRTPDHPVHPLPHLTPRYTHTYIHACTPPTQEEAAHAYDRVALTYLGPSAANLNVRGLEG